VGTRQFFELRDQLDAVLAGTPVQASLLEFQEPSIDQGWDTLVRQGVNHIHVAPLLLFAAGHAKQDIPQAIQNCQQRTPHITHDQCRPLSRNQAIIDLILERVESNHVEIQTDSSRTALVMTGRGSFDPCATSDMHLLRHLIESRTNFAKVVTAFYAMANPKLPEVLEKLASSNHFDAIMVQPHLLFEGRLYQAIIKQVETAATNHQKLQWRVGNYLGPEVRVAEAIATRISQSKIK